MRHGSKAHTASMLSGSKKRKKLDAKIEIFSLRMSKILRRKAGKAARGDRLPLGEWVRGLIKKEIERREAK